MREPRIEKSVIAYELATLSFSPTDKPPGNFLAHWFLDPSPFLPPCATDFPEFTHLFIIWMFVISLFIPSIYLNNCQMKSSLTDTRKNTTEHLTCWHFASIFCYSFYSQIDTAIDMNDCVIIILQKRITNGI